MLTKGQNPKEILIKTCEPECVHWRQRLDTCEKKLKSLDEADPHKNCIYPMRDWVTCVEACVQPKIQKHLIGQEKGWLS